MQKLSLLLVCAGLSLSAVAAHAQSEAPDTLVEDPDEAEEPADTPEAGAPDQEELDAPAEEAPAVDDRPPAREDPPRTEEPTERPRPAEERAPSRLREEDPLPDEDAVGFADFASLYGTGAGALGCMSVWTLFFHIMNAILPVVGLPPLAAAVGWPLFGGLVFCGLCCVLPGVEGLLIDFVGDAVTPLEGSTFATVTAAYLGTWGLGFVALGLSAFANAIAISVLSGDPQVWDVANQPERLGNALSKPQVWAAGAVLSVMVAVGVMAVAPAVPAGSYLILSDSKADIAAARDRERQRRRDRRRRYSQTRPAERPLKPMRF